MYNKIYDFCKVKNKGNCFSNGSEPTPRVKFLMDLLDKEGIKYELDIFQEERRVYQRPRFPMEKRSRVDNWRRWLDDLDDFPIHEDNEKEKNDKDNFHSEHETDFDYPLYRGRKPEYKMPRPAYSYDEPEEVTVNNYFNIIMKGTSNKMIVAHHDINNPNSDNANDNSASVINVIATKKLRPDVNAVLLDGEEFGGIGSKRLSTQINNGDFGSIEWVLNYELTGKGGKYFFIGNYPGKLTDKIVSLFNCPIVQTPFNDSIILRQNGIDSVVINPLPPLPEGQVSDVLFPDGKYLDSSMLFNCHSMKDSVSTISPEDMKEFVEEVVLKILK